MATTKTLTPTNQAITLAAFTEKPDNRTNVTNDDRLADAVNALNSNIASKLTDNVVILAKENTVSAGNVTFTFNENRHTSLIMIQDNTYSKSGVYAIIFKNGQTPYIQRIVGSETLPTVDANGSITVSLGAWSRSVLITTAMAGFS